MNERTALEIADDWRNDPMKVANCYNTPKYAAIILRQQHAKIERLEADAERVNSCAKNLAIAMHRKNFSHITQWELLPDTIGLLTQIDNMSCWTGDDVARLTAERDAAIAAAVLAEREACAAVCEAISTGLSAYRDGYGASACLEAIRARTRP